MPLLPYHERRMRQTQLHHWNIFANFSLEKEIKAAFAARQNPSPLQPTIIKCRVLYSMTIDSIEFVPYQAQSLRNLQLVAANNLDYSVKYSDRSALNSLKSKSAADDILICKNIFLTDISYANIAFFDESQWLTPKKPLLAGTRRQQLLENNTLIMRALQQKDLVNFSKIRIFNALIDTTYGYELKNDFLWLNP